MDKDYEFDPELTALRTAPPPEHLEPEYDEAAPGIWLANYLSADLAGQDAIVASIHTDVDRPGGADDAYLRRHGTHFAYTTTWTDGPTYLGEFATVADAVDAWGPHITGGRSTPTIVTHEENI